MQARANEKVLEVLEITFGLIKRFQRTLEVEAGRGGEGESLYISPPPLSRKSGATIRVETATLFLRAIGNLHVRTTAADHTHLLKLRRRSDHRCDGMTLPFVDEPSRVHTLKLQACKGIS